MDEKKRILKVIDRVEAELHAQTDKAQLTSHTNPIYKNLAKFRNSKIGEKFSLKDLFR